MTSEKELVAATKKNVLDLYLNGLENQRNKLSKSEIDRWAKIAKRCYKTYKFDVMDRQRNFIIEKLISQGEGNSGDFLVMKFFITQNLMLFLLSYHYIFSDSMGSRDEFVKKVSELASFISELDL